MNTIIKIVLSAMVGFVISILSRLSVFTFTTDFSYVKIGHYIFLLKNRIFITHYLNQSPETLKYIGKKVLGVGGFPFSTFSNCFLEKSGSYIIPVCDKLQISGEFSILFNTIFWSFITFVLVVFFMRIKKAFGKEGGAK